jgi:hypothetical protein
MFDSGGGGASAPADDPVARNAAATPTAATPAPISSPVRCRFNVFDSSSSTSDGASAIC